MFDKSIESQLKFPNRIIVKPVSGAATAAIGQNVLGGVIDELNYMAVTDDSKKSIDSDTYDQAIEVYNSIARRRKTRFMKQGKLPGILCLVSSKRYPGQFTDTKEEEARTDPTIFVYDKRVWDIKPWDYSGETFRVFIGDATRKPRLLKDGEMKGRKDEHLVDNVPVEYKKEFNKDIMNALRELAGHSTLALHPFIIDTESISRNMVGESVFSRDDCDFETTFVKVYKGRFEDPHKKRFCHIDLAITGDSAGFALGYVDGFVKVERMDGEYEILPNIIIDGILEIKPPPGGEILFSNIRKLIYAISKMGVALQWVTLDSFQSKDTMQILHQKGYITGMCSMDVTTAPYELTKSAFYDDRLLCPEHEKCQGEFAGLEKDTKKDKIDHPPNGSKDCSDAVAGVVNGLSTRLELWAEAGIGVDDIPHQVREASKRNNPQEE